MSLKTLGLYKTFIQPRLRSLRSEARGSIPDEVTNFFFSIYLTLPAALDPGVYSVSDRNEYHNIFLGEKRGRRVRADNFTAICEPSI
jgi:hypothetical protein